MPYREPGSATTTIPVRLLGDVLAVLSDDDVAEQVRGVLVAFTVQRARERQRRKREKEKRRRRLPRCECWVWGKHGKGAHRCGGRGTWKVDSRFVCGQHYGPQRHAITWTPEDAAERHRAYRQKVTLEIEPRQEIV